MPVDPEISLHVAGAQAPASPFDTIGKFAEIQSKLNEVRLFNQTFAARQAAGQIFATSPDMATATERISKDPMVSGFAPELVNLARQNQLVMMELQGKQQDQARSGFEGFVKALPQIYNHPENWGPMVNAQLDLLPPALRAQVGPSIEMIRKGLTDGLPTDPKAALDMYHSRLNGMMVAAGITPDLIHQVAGMPGQLNTGGATVGTMQTPAGEPGAGTLQPAPGGVGMTLPPQITNIPNPQGATTPTVIGGIAAPQPLGTTPNTTQAGELHAGAETAGDITKGASAITEVIPARINALDTIERVLKQTQLGAGTPTRTVAAQLAQGLKNIGLPISDDLVNKIAGGRLDAVQLFDTQLKPLLTGMLSHDAAGQGRVMLPEVEAYIKMLDTAKDPRAIVQALNNIRFGYQVGFDKADKWKDFKSAGGDPADFNRWYANQFDRSKLPSHAGSLRLTPLDSKGVRGGDPDKAPTLRWNPKTKKLEKI